MKKFSALFVSLLFAAQACAGHAVAVSADDAQIALARGAYVIDVRAAHLFAAGHLPQAVTLPTQAHALPLQELAKLLSQAGVDSSRTMLVVGEAGDVNAQALWQRLAGVTSGRVLWLVGGLQEWQLSGRTLTTEVSQRPPVPQFLTPFDTAQPRTRMAGDKVRSSILLEQNLSMRISAGL